VPVGILPAVVPVAVPGLEVRVWRESDAAALGAAIADSIEHLRAFMPWIAQEPIALADRVLMIRRWEAERLAGGDAVYGILRDGRVVGGTGAHRPDADRRPMADDAVEIGYWLTPDEQGRGTMTAVVRALTDLLLDLPGLTHVHIRMDEANVRSAAVPPRCGYRLVAQARREVSAPAETGVFLIWRAGADPEPEPAS
jgi:ribosomal-protein-serine acetyltransferase